MSLDRNAGFKITYHCKGKGLKSVLLSKLDRSISRHALQKVIGMMMTQQP
jgi:hypothetical protein